MTKRTNDKVKTKFGEGVVQGYYGARQDSDDQPKVLVRVAITDANRHALGSANCLTPHAGDSAIFIFAEGELA